MQHLEEIVISVVNLATFPETVEAVGARGCHVTSVEMKDTKVYTVRFATFPYIKLASTVTRGHSTTTHAMKLLKIKTICLDI